MSGVVAGEQAAATHRGTLLGGRLDCFVLAGGLPVIVPGRVASVEHAAFVRLVIDSAAVRVAFTDIEGRLHEGASSDAFIDSLCDYCADLSKPVELRQLGRAWLREFISRGAAVMAARGEQL